MNTPLEQSRALILNYDFSKVNFDALFDTEDNLYYDSTRYAKRTFDKINNQILHDAFKYFIGIKKATEIPSTLGYSKEGGHPHLPKDWEFPEEWDEFQFLAQLNIAEFKHLDKEHIFPENGIIYIFQHAEGDEEECRFYFYQGENDLLVERFDLSPLIEEAQPMKFTANWLFLLNGGYGLTNAIAELLPHDLKTNINNILNCEMTEESDNWGIEVMTDYAQGEDEDLDNETELTDERLLYRTNIFGVSIHFWIDKDALKAGNFDKAYQDMSGT